MYQFRGIHHLSIDDKGRVAVPARYRDDLEKGCDSKLFVTLGVRGSLEIYPADKYRELELQIPQMEDRRKASILRNRLVGFADELELDKQGRIVLPSFHRRRYNLIGAAVLMGQTTHFRLWTEAEFDRIYNDDPAREDEVEDAYDALPGR